MTRDCCNDVELDFDPDTRVAFEDPMVADEDIEDNADREGFDLVSFPSLTQTPCPLLQQLLAFFGMPQQKLPSLQGVTVEVVSNNVGPAVFALLIRSIAVSLLPTPLPPKISWKALLVPLVHNLMQFGLFHDGSVQVSRVRLPSW